MGNGSERRKFMSPFSSKDCEIDKDSEEKRSEQHFETDVVSLKHSSEPVDANDWMKMDEEFEVVADYGHDRNSRPGGGLKTDEATLFKSSYKQSNEDKEKNFFHFIMMELIRIGVFNLSSLQLNHVYEILKGLCVLVRKEAGTNLEILTEKLVGALADNLTCTRNERFEKQALDAMEDGLSRANAEGKADSSGGDKVISTTPCLDEESTGQERNETKDHLSTPDLDRGCENVCEGAKRPKSHHKDDKTDMLRRHSESELTEQSRPLMHAELRNCRDKKTAPDSQGRVTPDRRHAEEDKHVASASPDHEHPEDEAGRKFESTAPSSPTSAGRNSCRQDANASPARGDSLVQAKSFHPVSLKTTDNSDENVAETADSCAEEPEAASDSEREDSVVSNGSQSTHPVQGSLDRSTASPTRSETVTSIDTGMEDSRERKSSASLNALTSVPLDTLHGRQQMCDKLSEHQSASRPSTDSGCTDEMAPTNTPNETKSDAEICNKDCDEAQMSVSESWKTSSRRDTMTSASQLGFAEGSRSGEESKDSAIAKPGFEFSRSEDGCPHDSQAAKSRTKPCDRKEITNNFDMQRFMQRISQVGSELNEHKKKLVNEDVSVFSTLHHARIDRKNENLIPSHDAEKVRTREKNGQANAIVSETSTGLRQQQTSSENGKNTQPQFIAINSEESVKAFCNLLQECDNKGHKEFCDESDSKQGSPEMNSEHIPSWPSKRFQHVGRNLTPGPHAHANIDCNAKNVTKKVVEKVTTTTAPLEQATSLQSAPCQTVTTGRVADLKEAQTGRASEDDYAGTESSVESVRVPPLIPTGAGSDHGCEQMTDLDNSRNACFPEQAPANKEPESLQAQFDSSGTKNDDTSHDDAASRQRMRCQKEDNETRGEEELLCTKEGPEPFGVTEDGQGADETVAEEQKESAQNGAETSRAHYPVDDSLGANVHHIPSQGNSTTCLDGSLSCINRPTEQQPTSGQRTCSVFVSSEENVPMSDPREVQTEEVETHTNSANEVPESHSPYDSGLHFDPVSEIEREKARHSHSPRGFLDPLDFDCFRKAGGKRHIGDFDKAGKGNRVHSPEQRNPHLIMVSLADVRKSKHSPRRTDDITPPFSTADMQDIHAGRRSKIHRISPLVDLRQRSELNPLKRRQDQEDIDVLWQTVNNPDRTFSFVVVTHPFFPREFSSVSQLMSLESMRLASFQNFPHDHCPSTLRLANAGFFYTGQEGILTCYFCGVTFRCDRNSAGVNPYAIHSPECSLVRGFENRNLFIQDEQRRALSERDITGDESDNTGAFVPRQVQVSRGALNSSMTTFVAKLEATTNRTAATADTVQLSDQLTVPSGNDSPTTQSAEATGTVTAGTTNTPLSPGPRTNESGYFSANGPLSEPRSTAGQGQSLTMGDLSRGQNPGLDSASSTATTAPAGPEASLTSRDQAPPRQPPGDGIRTTSDIHTRNSPSPLETSSGPQGLSSSTSQRHQTGGGDRQSESSTTSTHLSEPRVEALGPPGASRDRVVTRTAAGGVSSPPLRSEGVASGTLLQASHQVPRAIPQMVYNVVEPQPSLQQDRQATPQGGADSAPTVPVYDASRALHRHYTDLSKRESSFQRWPDTHGQSPEELAVAGFFYTGVGDCVRCHYCGLGLKDWDPEDRAMDEHVRWRSSCGYLQEVLGGQFIARTLARLGQRRAETPSQSRTWFTPSST